MNLHNCRCIVIKIGSSLLVDEEKGCINNTWLSSLIDDVVALTRQNINVVLVSSGAIAFGKIAMNSSTRQISLETKQAFAAIGQIQLMHNYQALLNQHGMKGAQVLLNSDDIENKSHYLNLKSTLSKLLEMNIVPIINENDSVATDEMRYGDNDRLAAKVAQLVMADALILLSDVDGFYTDDPRISSSAKLIPKIEELSPDIMAMAKNSKSNYGSGGMITKLLAADIAMEHGCHMLITAGKPTYPISNFLSTGRGTWFISNRMSNIDLIRKQHQQVDIMTQ